jgi:hypothetical protein
LEKDTPSDYALLVRNVPQSFAKDKDALKDHLEKEYSSEGVKVSEVNYCYEINQMVTLKAKVAKLNL